MSVHQRTEFDGELADIYSTYISHTRTVNIPFMATFFSCMLLYNFSTRNSKEAWKSPSKVSEH